MRLLTTAEVARLVGLTPSALRTPRWDQLLLPIRLESGLRLFDRARVENICSERLACGQVKKVV